MDDEIVEEILYPLYLECQSMDGDEKVEFAQYCARLVYEGIDKWWIDEIELDEVPD